MAKSDDNKTSMVEPDTKVAIVPLPTHPVEPKKLGYTGSYKNLKDGLTYGLKVNDKAAKTHRAMSLNHNDEEHAETYGAGHPGFSWDGTREEFRAQFEVSDSDKRAPKEDGEEDLSGEKDKAEGRTNQRVNRG